MFEPVRQSVLTYLATLLYLPTYQLHATGAG